MVKRKQETQRVDIMKKKRVEAISAIDIGNKNL